MAIAWKQNQHGFEGTQTDWSGYVLEKIHDNNYRIMSDIWGSADWALVWDATKKCPVKLCVNVYDMNPSGWSPTEIVVDATEEVKQAYRDWQVKREYERLLGNAEIAANQIEKGCIAKVVRGRNGKGTVGKVVVMMDASYGMGYRASVEKKLAIATSDVKIKKPLRSGKVAEVYQDVVWVWARNVQRVDIAEINQHALWLEAEKRVVRPIAA